MSGPRIAVIGLGATGAAVLYQLARRGVRALGIERFHLGHANGSSHGPTRIIRLAHFENAAYVPLMQRAYALWHELENVSGERLVFPTGIAEIGPAEGELVRGSAAGASRYALAHEMIDAASLMRRYPQFKVPRSFAAVLQPDGGYIVAAAALLAEIRVAAAAGAIIRTGEIVVAIEPLSNRVLIRTAGDVIEVDGVVLAAGPWLCRLLPELHLPLRVTRQVVGWFADDGIQFSAERFPVFILESEHGIHYGFPAYGRMGIKIAKHHHLSEVVDAEGYDRALSAADEAAIRGPLREYLPAADGRLLSAETCLYTMTPDGTFIIDRMPGFPHVVIASPCCGYGFKFSPVIGEIITDLLIRGETHHNIAQFALRRFT